MIPVPPYALPPNPGGAARLEWEEVHGKLSPSQVGTYLDCSAKWHYKHRLRLPDPPNSNLAIGRAVHETIAEILTEQTNRGEQIDENVIEVYARNHAHRELAAAQLAKDEDPEQLANLTAAMVQEWNRSAAARVIPRRLHEGYAIETNAAAVIGGVVVVGKIDVISSSGNCVIDWKTAAKAPAGISNSQRLQLTTYAVMIRAVAAQVVTITKAKTPRVITQTFEISLADRQFVDRIYPTVADAMDSGVVVPNRTSLLCSRKNCPFAERCAEDYGGEIA